jgi:hypothetical protein
MPMFVLTQFVVISYVCFTQFIISDDIFILWPNFAPIYTVKCFLTIDKYQKITLFHIPNSFLLFALQ